MHLIVTEHQLFLLTHLRLLQLHTYITDVPILALPQICFVLFFFSNTTRLLLNIPVMILDRQSITISTNPTMYIYKLLFEFEV